jgi:hypothetical protein
MTHRARAIGIFSVLVLFAATISTGCQILGLAQHMAPPPTIDAAYKGLDKQQVAVMVWTDRAMAIDWPKLQEDLSRGITTRIKDAATGKDAPKFLEGATFALPESVTRFQHDHPETDTQDIQTVATRMNVSRLIYLEVTKFETRPESSLELFRGSITANLKILEVSADKAKIVYQRDNIALKYPEKAPDEGAPGMSDVSVYEKTIEACATEIANVFIPHPAPDEN